MNSKKWIFSACVMAVSLTAFASTTKVGNGDDGRDLEGAVPVTSGIIFETRAEAVATLKALNIQGVPGLGLLISELEHTDLLLAKSDVHPLATEGDWERSADGHRVFARTFAESLAPTRFFPAALKLTREQLIALHIHEALHRSLAPGVRENEDKVALLTMAITSPSATFDRVNRVAQNTLQESEAPRKSWAEGTSSMMASTPSPTLPPAKTQVGLSHTSYAPEDSYAQIVNVEKFSVSFSPFAAHLWDLPMQAQMSVEELLMRSHGGPLSLTEKFLFQFDTEKTAGPLVQVNLKSLERYPGIEDRIDRDVYTLGGFYEQQRPYSYKSVILTYTLPGTASMTYEPDIHVSSIWSIYLRQGIKYKRFSLGGAAELHHAQSYWATPEAFTILRGGPEVSWTNGRFNAGLSAAWMLNHGPADLDALGDVAGHGAGASSATLKLSYEM